MERQMKKNKGFSLIELLIAVTILSIIMIMVTQFMSTTSWAVTRTKKNQSIQTEAMEVGGQLTDTLMQATYVRVQTQNKDLIDVTTDLTGTKKERTVSTAKTGSFGHLVVDNFPKCLNNPLNPNPKIIVNPSDEYTIVNELGNQYSDWNGQKVNSFRLLKSGKDPDQMPYYVKPKYIYVQYKQKEASVESDAYAIFWFDGNAIYVNRGKMSDLGTTVGDGFNQACSKVQSSNSLLSDHVLDCYFSADTEANTLYMDMTFENPKFRGFSYNYVESVILRNTNVLTVPPQQLYQWKY